MRNKDGKNSDKRQETGPADETAVPPDKPEPAAPDGEKSWKVLGQVGVVFGVCLVGEGIAAVLPVPFPASVVSMVLLFLLLLTKVIRPCRLKEKAGFLMENMAIFFVPAGVGIMTHFDAIRDSLLPLLAVCVLTTVITFAAAAFTVRGVVALQNRVCARRAGCGDAGTGRTEEKIDGRGNHDGPDD